MCVHKLLNSSYMYCRDVAHMWKCRFVGKKYVACLTLLQRTEHRRKEHNACEELNILNSY